MESQDPRLASQPSTYEGKTPPPPLVGGNSRCAWLVQDAHSLFHKWRMVNCAEPSNLSASGSQEVEREQHLTGRNKQKRYLDLQAKLVRDVDDLFNVRVEGSVVWSPGQRLGYTPRRWLPRLDRKLGPLYVQLYRYHGFRCRGSSNLWRLLSFLTFTGVVDQHLTRVTSRLISGTP